MREEIIDICVEVVRRTRYPDADRESVWRNPAHAAAVVALLKDCRPLPVIRDLIGEMERSHGLAG